MCRGFARRVTTVLVALVIVLVACQPNQSSQRAGSRDSSAGASGASAPAAAPPQSAPKRGGTLTLGMVRDMAAMNPLVGTKSNDKTVRWLMFEPLLGLDQQGRLQPHLAESWRVAPDGKLYTFTLRQGVRFHNGQEMTAEDVKFSVDYTMNPRNGATGYTKLNLVDRVEATDRYTVAVHLKTAGSGFLPSLGDIRSFSVIPRDSVPEGVDKPSTFPPGTGPFKFVQWQPKQRLVFDRHEEYWGHKAYLDRLVIVPIDDDTVRFTALRAGDVDLVEDAPYEWVRQIQDGKLPGLTPAEAAFSSVRRIVFNLTSPPFDNPRLRAAVAHAIDRNEILQAAYFGFARPAEQKYPRGHAWYIDGLSPPAYDLDRARTLLREAGYNGETIELLINASPTDQAEAATLQAQLRRIGVNLRITSFEAGVVNAMQRRGEFAFYLSGGSFLADPALTYGPDLRCEPDLARRASNNSGYCSREMDALLERAETELDAGRQRELFKQVLSRVNEDLPQLFVGFVPEFFAVRDHVKGFVTNDEGDFVWWGGGLHHAWLDK
jgi:peptide/nickel transport system substrate-binding protein